jgi:hypothetical protein
MSPSAEEAWLDEQEARALRGIERGMRGLDRDVSAVVDVRRLARSHPVLAMGLAAIVGIGMGRAVRLRSLVPVARVAAWLLAPIRLSAAKGSTLVAGVVARRLVRRFLGSV